jgi:glycosyltransferase involved in cell wall biosynthesis
MTKSPDSPGDPLRVLMIGKGWFPEQTGGLDRYFRELVEHLPEARAVVVGRSGLAGSARVRAVAAHDLPLPLRLWTLTRAIGEEARNADIIDIHFALYAFVPMLLGRFRGKKIVVHFHGPWADENVESGDSSPRRLRMRRALERYVYRRATLAITLTGAFRRVLVERYGVSPWRVKVLAPGVDLARFASEDRASARQWLSVPADAFVVSCVRRLVPRMGLRVLLEAWSQLLASRELDSGDQQVPRLLIAGDGAMRGALGEEIAANGLSDSVSLLGMVTDEHLAQLYRAADVNVVPSLSSEGFGLVVLEAGACGTPTIATRVGGLPEALAGLDASLIVAPNDPGALSERLTAARDGNLPDRQATRAWAAQSRWDLVAERHRRAYARLVEHGPSGHRKIRVAYVGHVAQLSGGEIALVRLIDALDDVDAHVILAHDGPLVARLLASGISVEVLPMHERTRDLRKDRIRPGGLPITALLDTATYAFRLARRFRTIQPDLVHTNTLKAGIYGSLAGRAARVPAVWHVRDRIASDYLNRPAALLVRALIATLPSGVVANSEATRATLWSAPERTRVVHSIVHDPIASPPARAERTPGEDFVVGMVGRIAPWKGQHVFLEAFARAFDGGSEVAVLVGDAMFGEAEAAYGRVLREMTQVLGVADRVEFRGFRHDVWSELARMDVFVHASVSPEPFGQVVVEAMLAGIPVIASAGGGPSEILTSGVEGILYPSGDVDALAEALRLLRRDAPLRRHLVSNARIRAQEFSPRTSASSVMSLYGQVLASSTAGHR